MGSNNFKNKDNDTDNISYNQVIKNKKLIL